MIENTLFPVKEIAAEHPWFKGKNKNSARRYW